MAWATNDHFPWSLEQASKEGLGAAAWTKDDGSRLWLERTEDGFEVAAFWGGTLALGAKWKWEGLPNESSCALTHASGVHALALEASGLNPKAKHARVMEIMGAMAMGPGRFAEVAWEDWQAVRSSGLGFAEAMVATGLGSEVESEVTKVDARKNVSRRSPHG